MTINEILREQSTRSPEAHVIDVVMGASIAPCDPCTWPGCECKLPCEEPNAAREAIK